MTSSLVRQLQCIVYLTICLWITVAAQSDRINVENIAYKKPTYQSGVAPEGYGDSSAAVDGKEDRREQRYCIYANTQGVEDDDIEADDSRGMDDDGSGGDESSNDRDYNTESYIFSASDNSRTSVSSELFTTDNPGGISTITASNSNGVSELQSSDATTVDSVLHVSDNSSANQDNSANSSDEQDDLPVSTNGRKEAWWYIDLLGHYNVTGFSLVAGQDEYVGYLARMYLEIRNDTDFFHDKENKENCYTFKKNYRSTHVSRACRHAAVGRFVVLRQSTSNANQNKSVINICELQLFGNRIYLPNETEDFHINTIHPNYGPLVGGTTVTITVSKDELELCSNERDNVVYDRVGFVARDPHTEFCTARCSWEQCNGTCTCTVTSRHQPDHVMLSISNATLITLTSDAWYRYKPDPHVAAMTPNETFTSGGTYITITGRDLNCTTAPLLTVLVTVPSGDTVALYGDCPADSRTDTQIRCITPSIKEHMTGFNMSSLSFTMSVDFRAEPSLNPHPTGLAVYKRSGQYTLSSKYYRTWYPNKETQLRILGDFPGSASFKAGYTFRIGEHAVHTQAVSVHDDAAAMYVPDDLLRTGAGDTHRVQVGYTGALSHTHYAGTLHIETTLLHSVVWSTVVFGVACVVVLLVIVVLAVLCKVKGCCFCCRKQEKEIEFFSNGSDVSDIKNENKEVWYANTGEIGTPKVQRYLDYEEDRDMPGDLKTVGEITLANPTLTRKPRHHQHQASSGHHHANGLDIHIMDTTLLY